MFLPFRPSSNGTKGDKQHEIGMPDEIYIPHARVGACVGVRVGHNAGKVTQNKEVTRILGFVLGPQDFFTLVSVTRKSHIGVSRSDEI